MKKLLPLFMAFPFLVNAQDNKSLDPVVVTATRYELSNLQAPASVSQLDVSGIGLKFTPAESLNRIAGLSVTDPIATDIKFTTRGFGSRSSYASRGVQIYRDGLPVTFADGIGQTSLVDMTTIDTIEVMKGPFSSMYGTSSSGVIQFFTKVPTKDEISVGYVHGDFNTTQKNVTYSGVSNNIKYMFNQTDFVSDGYRDFSKLNRDQSTAKMWITTLDYNLVEVGANMYRQTNQDYGNGNGGLTAAQFATNPYSVDKSVYNINGWKTVDQQDANIKITNMLSGNDSLVFAVYGGNRNQEQLSPTTESNTLARTSSGLLKTARQFWGSELRLDHKGVVVNKNYDVSVGISAQEQTDLVTNGKWMVSGVQNDGSTLTRGVNQNALTVGQYIQGRLELTEKLDVHAGIRKTTMSMDFEDHLTTAANGGNNSGNLKYDGTTPSVGLVWKATPSTSFFTSYAKGMELPTFNETQFSTAVATTTPNTTLKPSKSDNYEIGVKSYLTPKTYMTASVFQAKTNDEIVITTNVPGYKIYSNLGNTTRQGVEFDINSKLPYGFGFYTALSYVEAKFDDTQKYIPAVPNVLAFSEFSWTNKPQNFKVAVEAVHSGKLYGEVDNSISSDSYTIYNIKASAKQQYNRLTFSEYLAVNNIENKVYVANLRTAAQYGRYYESGVARNTVIGVNASYAF
jgi:iron complex outermembrane receptor protein